jgi:hypothetical protein
MQSPNLDQFKLTNFIFMQSACWMMKSGRENEEQSTV